MMGPLPAVTCAFACGILLAAGLGDMSLHAPFAAALGFSGLGALLHWKKRKYVAAAVLAACLCTGFMTGSRLSGGHAPGHVRKALENGEALLSAELVSRGTRKTYGLTFTIAAEKLTMIAKGDHEAMREHSNVAEFPRLARVYVADRDAKISVEEGDRVILKNLEELEPKALRNPDAAQAGRKPAMPVFTTSQNSIIVYPGKGGPLARLRNLVSARLAYGLSHDSAGFSEAIVTGRADGLDKGIKERFRGSGLAHLLAVSGLHLSVVALLVMGLLRAAISRMPFIAGRVPAQWIASVLSCPLLWLFAFFASGKPPVIRAAVMVTAFQVACMIGRKSVFPSTLSLAALVLLVIDPANIKSPSFLLSFSAVAGIFLFSGSIKGAAASRLPWVGDTIPELSGRIRRAAHGALSFFLDIVSVGAAAAFSTLPLTCFFFHRIPLLGIVSNVAAVPLFSFLVLPLNIVYCVLLAATAAPPRWAVAAVDLVNGFFLSLVHACSLVPPLQVLPAAGMAAGVFFAACVVLLGAGKKRASAVLFAAALMAIFIPAGFEEARRHFLTRDRMTVIFAEVGQGDGALIRTPGGRHVLIDSGPPDGNGDFTRFVKKWTGGRLALLVITHGHTDHYGGAQALLDAGIDVKQLWVSPQGFEERQDKAYIRLVESFGSRGTQIVKGPPCGRAVDVGGVALSVISPCEPDGYDYLMDWNNNSIVIHARYGRAGFLFTGDIEREGEARLAAGPRPPAQVIKIPHHGSAGSSGSVITGWPGALLGVATAGADNTFGFPHARVLKDLGEAGVDVLRVDRDGAWIAATDGSSILVRDYRWNERLELQP
ncbi:MAG: DNA internalization-related competence protein ComEC/Rec2 [Pseudomonadota bacterium]